MLPDPGGSSKEDPAMAPGLQHCCNASTMTMPLMCDPGEACLCQVADHVPEASPLHMYSVPVDPQKLNATGWCSGPLATRLLKNAMLHHGDWDCQFVIFSM